MPWTEADVSRHTKSARTAAQKRQWVHVANRVLAETGDEARAIREANGVVASRPATQNTKRRRR